MNSTEKQGPFLDRYYFKHSILDEHVVWLYCIVEMQAGRTGPGNELAHSPGTNQFLMLVTKMKNYICRACHFTLIIHCEVFPYSQKTVFFLLYLIPFKTKPERSRL